MTRYLPLLILLAVMTGCSRQQAVEGAPPVSRPGAAVTLDAKLQNELGIQVETARKSALEGAVMATGQLQMNEDATWQIGALTEGKIVAVPVRVGDSIREGQVLAALHSHEVHDARATYRQVQAELQKQKTLAEQALTVRDRTRRLFELRAASKEQLEAAETLYRSAMMSVTNAQAEADKAEFHLTDYLDVPVQAPAKSSGDPTRDTITIKSPATGTLMVRHATAGTVVSVGDPVFTVSNLSSLWMIAAVNEADLSRVHRKQRVGIQVRAFPDRTFPGTVLQIGERMDPQTRTLQVRVLVPNPQGLLKPEMFATAEFASEGSRAAVQVPEAAVQRKDDKDLVFIQQKDGSFLPREVKAGTKANGLVEILSGLEPGTPIAVKGAFLLKARLIKDSEQPPPQ